MLKSFSCVLCSMLVVEIEGYLKVKETIFGFIIVKMVLENDVVCSKCILYFYKGILRNKLYVSFIFVLGVSIYYLGIKLFRICFVCG